MDVHGVPLHIAPDSHGAVFARVPGSTVEVVRTVASATPASTTPAHPSQDRANVHVAGSQGGAVRGPSARMHAVTASEPTHTHDVVHRSVAAPLEVAERQMCVRSRPEVRGLQVQTRHELPAELVGSPAPFELAAAPSPPPLVGDSQQLGSRRGANDGGGFCAGTGAGAGAGRSGSCGRSCCGIHCNIRVRYFKVQRLTRNDQIAGRCRIKQTVLGVTTHESSVLLKIWSAFAEIVLPRRKPSLHGCLVVWLTEKVVVRW